MALHVGPLMNHPMVDCLRHRQRALFHQLNNLGVALVERGRFARAIAVWECLAYEAKIHFHLTEVQQERHVPQGIHDDTSRPALVPEEKGRLASSVARLESKLREASQELAQPLIDLPGPDAIAHKMSFPTRSCHHNRYCLEMSTLLSNSTEIEYILRYPSLASAGMLIKMAHESYHVYPKCLLSQQELECAMVLYNLGVAYFLYTSHLHRVLPGPTALLDEYWGHACWLLRISLVYLHLLKTEMTLPDDSKLSNILLVESLVLATAAYLSLQLGGVMDAKGYVIDLVEVRAELAWILSDGCDLIFQAAHRGRNAAAAA